MSATATRPLFRLTDPQWEWVRPFLFHGLGEGRPLSDDGRRRVEAILHVALSRRPWRDMPEAFGRPDTVHRHFRRLAHAGGWERLLVALAKYPRSPLSELRAALCLAARRSWRIRGERLRHVATRLGLPRALPKPPEFYPQPRFDALLRETPLFGFLGNRALGEALRDPALNRAVATEIRWRRALHDLAGGLRRVPARLRAAW